jgi:hypothetical protein
MNLSEGTPQTLEQAITNGMIHARESSGNPLTLIRWHIRDYLSQRFGVAMLSPVTPELLQQLWTAITGEKFQQPTPPLQSEIDKAVGKERERCARVCESNAYIFQDNEHQPWAKEVNLAIRGGSKIVADLIRKSV